jgi:hypothetical protein
MHQKFNNLANLYWSQFKTKTRTKRSKSWISSLVIARSSRLQRIGKINNQFWMLFMNLLTVVPSLVKIFKEIWVFQTRLVIWKKKRISLNKKLRNKFKVQFRNLGLQAVKSLIRKQGKLKKKMNRLTWALIKILTGQDKSKELISLK